MKRALIVCCVLSITIDAAGSRAVACLWDYDTLKMEREQFPSALELITGKFRRHSLPYYQWRIKDRIQKLKSDPQKLEWYDDLAVAYDKVGQHDKAIETILKKDAIKPGMYETIANLGTFYIHSGQLEKGVEHIKRAITINPDAHFGREIYQRLLVEYVLIKRIRGKIVLPLEFGERTAFGPFATFILSRRYPIGGDVDKELARAVKGVLGMMRFGKYDSPILLEALGDLLSEQGKRSDRYHGGAKRLAARAYLKASYEVKDEQARRGYRKMAKFALLQQSIGQVSASMPIADLEARFQDELKQAKEWSAQLEADEKKWIAAGGDVDAEFDRAYFEEPTLATNYPDDQTWHPLLVRVIVVAACLLTLVVTVLLFLVILSRKRQRLQTAAESGQFEEA